MSKNAWLIYDGVEGYPIDVTTFICLDETDALETYMSLVEEEMFEAFYGITQDSLESIEQDWEERAQWMSPWWTMWCVMEVPIIYGDSCSEELSKPARGQRALLGVW